MKNTNQNNIDLNASNIKIFILEDEFIIAQDILEFLKEKGFSNIKTSTDYNRANTITRTWSPNLILCDINLGGKKSGIDFCLQLKNDFNNIDVIFISALTDIRTLDKANTINPINYITKPFNYKQLYVSIMLALNAINIKRDNNSNSLKYLSHSEISIIYQIARGKNSNSIAESLSISPKTVRNHRYNIAKKLNLPSQKNSLLKWAISNINSK